MDEKPAASRRISWLPGDEGNLRRLHKPNEFSNDDSESTEDERMSDKTNLSYNITDMQK